MWSDDYGRDDDRNRRGGRGGDRRDQHDDPNDQQWQSRGGERESGRDPGYQGPQWNPIYGNQSPSGGRPSGGQGYDNQQFGQSGYGRGGYGQGGSDNSQRSLGGRDDPYQRYARPQPPASRDGGESFGNPNDRERQGGSGSIWGGAESRYTGGQGGYGGYTGGHSPSYGYESQQGFRNEEYRGNPSGGNWQWSDERGGNTRDEYRRPNPREHYRSQSWLEAQGQHGPGWAESQNQRAGQGWAQNAAHPSSGYFYERPNRDTSSGHSDWSRQQGPHEGRGPKGWKRSDDRIKEDINEQLSRHPNIDASDLEVKVEQGEVTLTGTVDDRYAKRMAEDIVEQVYGVTDVQNQIRVSRGGGDRSTSREVSASSSDREVSRQTEREGRSSTDMHADSKSRSRGAPTGSSVSDSTGGATTGAGGSGSTSTAGGSSGNT